MCPPDGERAHLTIKACPSGGNDHLRTLMVASVPLKAGEDTFYRVFGGYMAFHQVGSFCNHFANHAKMVFCHWILLL